MRRCVIHIGHAKTATSYLQHCLHLNEELLRAHNWWVPSDFSALGFSDFGQASRAGIVHSGNLSPMHQLLSEGPGDLVPAMLKILFDAPDMPHGSDLLLSSELFFYYYKATAHVIRAARAHGFAPEVIAYVARQDRSVVPSYLQYVRNHGYADGVIDFLLHDPRMPYLRYQDTMENLEKEASELPITLRTFDPEFLLDGDIFADFLQAVGCNLPPRLCARPREGGNEALLLEQYELLRAAALLDRPDAIERLWNAGPTPTAEQHVRLHSFYYRPHVQTFLVERYMQRNTDLLARYMPHATVAEYDFWQRSDPAPPKGSVDTQLLHQLRHGAFG